MSDEAKKPLRAEDITTTRTSRRSAIGSIAGAVFGAAALVVGGTARAQETPQPDPLCSDSDPNDPAGRGSHCSDPGGRGSHCSDSDPNDPGGRGRSCADSD